MIDVALLSAIRRWHLRDGIPIREIARPMGLSRNTIRKYLANGTLKPVYPKRRSPSKLDPYAQTLASWLRREASRCRKQRRDWRQLNADLVALRYPGSYGRGSSVCPGVEADPAGGRASEPRHVCAAGVRARRGIPLKESSLRETRGGLTSRPARPEAGRCGSSPVSKIPR